VNSPLPGPDEQTDAEHELSQPGRRVSFYALIATAVAVGVLLYRVIEPFLLPLFLAAVLALLFRPAQDWLTARFHGQRYFAAGLLTVAIMLLGLGPLGTALVFAGQELFNAAEELLEVDWREQPYARDALKFLDKHDNGGTWLRWQESTTKAVEGATREVYTRTRSLISNLIGFVVGVGIVTLSLFYFLADGPVILRACQRISPLDNADELALFKEFDRVCRGVVIASVATALAQAVLAGIGFAFVGVDRVWLMSGLTMVFSLIPFIGAAGVWICVSISLFFSGNTTGALALAIYGAAVVSTADNLIRMYLIHGTVRLHPLVALISVLGAIRVLGLWGILIGPVVAAFFYALMKILHDRVNPPTSSAVPET